MTHQFKDCTIDLRGAGYACVSRGDEFEIGHTGEGDRVLIYGDTLDFTGLHILGPVALADRIKAAVALECYAMTTERDALRGELARLTAGRDAEIARLTAERRMIISHATMGGTDGDGLSVNAVSVQITALRNELYQDGKSRAEKAEAERDAALAKAWTMATAAMAERAKIELSAAWAADLIVRWAQSMTPPADLAARIGGEA